MRNILVLTSRLFIGIVLAVQLSSGTTRAKIYTVKSIGNSGAGTLRQAISDANNNAGEDTITFDAATDGFPIVLAGVAGEDNNSRGDLDILGNGDLTIQGNGTANTIIDGGGIDRVFHVCPGGGCFNNNVTIKGVTIRNGSVGGGHGGGIYNNGDTTLVGSAVSSNAATYGGGIYNRGELSVQSGSIIGGDGAGNTATDSGGGICNVHGSVKLKSSTITANIALNGGGIYNYINSEISVDNSTINSNTAGHSGGGIHNEGTLSIQNGSIIGGVGTGNKAGGGAGISNGISGTTTVDSSTISANDASCVGGGGILNEGKLNILNGSTIGGIGAGNMATGTDTCDGQGGGIYNHGMAMVINSIISANISIENYGGGISNRSIGTITVDSSTVSANSAITGGGINNWGTLNLSKSTIGGTGAGNTASTLGGGIFNSGTTIVDKSIISANTAQKYGGGIYNSDYADNTIVTNSCIMNNRATINGGGLFNDKDSFWAIKVTGSNIAGNSATSFFNNQDALQSATDNWWGVATGPDTPGADTVGGNVDRSSYLTEPIPCLKVGSFPWSLFLPAIIGKERL